MGCAGSTEAHLTTPRRSGSRARRAEDVPIGDASAPSVEVSVFPEGSSTHHEIVDGQTPFDSNPLREPSAATAASKRRKQTKKNKKKRLAQVDTPEGAGGAETSDEHVTAILDVGGDPGNPLCDDAASTAAGDPSELHSAGSTPRGLAGRAVFLPRFAVPGEQPPIGIDDGNDRSGDSSCTPPAMDETLPFESARSASLCEEAGETPVE